MDIGSISGQSAKSQEDQALLGAPYEALYADYYSDRSLQKRLISATQTVAHLGRAVKGLNITRLLDVGAGEGSVLSEISRAGLAKELYAVEISSSGIEALTAKQIPRLRAAQMFDGYRIPYPDKYFDLVLGIHVLEHVEHERLFLREMSRVARFAYIEVPLELGLKVRRAIDSGRKFGHINFYMPATLLGLLHSSGLSVVKQGVFAASKEYEVCVGGRMYGPLKHLVRRFCLSLAPGFAPWFLTYNGYALCGRP